MKWHMAGSDPATVNYALPQAVSAPREPHAGFRTLSHVAVRRSVLGSWRLSCPYSARVSIHAASAALILALLSGGCALHGVQLVKPDWHIPPAYAECEVRGDRFLFHGRWQVVATCLDGLRTFDEETKQETEFVAWKDLQK